jgi:hypothetical protein
VSDSGKHRSRSERAYARLLSFYPHEFRREYAREMTLIFADRFRTEAEGHGRGALLRVWGEALLDLARSAPKQHLEVIWGGMRLMKTLRTIALALVAYAVTLLVIAPLYARNAGSMPGFVAFFVDALISTGLMFNFIFLLLTLTRWLEGVRAVRVTLALTTLVIAALLAVMMFSLGARARINVWIVVAQVLSLLIWFSVHLWWVQRRRMAQPPAATA